MQKRMILPTLLENYKKIIKLNRFTYKILKDKIINIRYITFLVMPQVLMSSIHIIK